MSRGLFAIAAIGLIAGCGPLEPEVEADLPASGLSGSMGAVRDFRREATVEASGSSVRLDSEDTSARWWAMTRMSFSDPSWRSLPVGAVVRPDPVRGDVRIIGCSGPQRDRYTFDHPGSVTSYQVGPGATANQRRIYFTAVFMNESVPETVHGAFVYDVQ